MHKSFKLVHSLVDQMLSGVYIPALHLHMKRAILEKNSNSVLPRPQLFPSTDVGEGDGSGEEYQFLFFSPTPFSLLLGGRRTLFELIQDIIAILNSPESDSQTSPLILGVFVMPPHII